MPGDDNKAHPLRSFTADHTIEFYRQPGGCVEIWQTTDCRKENDVVHICDDVTRFIAELSAFAKETAPDRS